MARKFLYLIAILIVLLLAGFTTYRLFSKEIFEAVFVPDVEFTEQAALAENAYADEMMWFSRPGIVKNNPTLWTPPDMEAGGSQRVAIFYVHPTSYLKADRWNGPLDDAEANARARLFLRSQASAFNNLGTVWAPRYRQAAFGAFLTNKDEARQAMLAAYADVEQAFDYFLTQIPEDQPIILAGHSQGSLHLTNLLRRRVAGKPLAKRIVAAYVVGWPVSLDTDIDALGLPACDDPQQTGCVLSWESFGEDGDPEMVLAAYDATTGFDGRSRSGTAILCTNPVTGTIGAETTVEENRGTLVPNADLTDGTLETGFAAARCNEQGFLIVTQLPELPGYTLPGENLHVFDYPLFWADVRADAARRLSAFEAR